MENSNKVLVIGSGGREHALAWKISQSKKVNKVYVAPGNAGINNDNSKISNIPIQVEEIDRLIRFVKTNNITLTIVGPEIPLSLGIVDSFENQNLKILGTNKFATKLESSKAFSKEFMLKYNIPTAKHQSFTNVEKALDYLKNQKLPIVIKASGLAAGKGVIISHNMQEARLVVIDMLANNRFGESGSEIIIEEFLEGEEASFIALSDGNIALPFATSQDHKAIFNNDQGENTGGMGAYSPSLLINNDLHKKIMGNIINKVLDGIKKEGSIYKGFLYAGLMIKGNDIKVLEFNCRLGDPETQVIMMRLDSDLYDLAINAIEGNLNKNNEIVWRKEKALGVILASKGYPNSYKKGDVILGLENIDNNINTKVFHSGTKLENNKFLTNGGRVLCVCSLGKNIQDAQNKSYNLVNKISWDNMYYRTDIGFKALLN